MPPTPELIPIVSLPTLYNPRDLALIRRTVASDTTDDEFALFIHWARRLRLDPLRRQVHAFVFHKHDPKKRRLSLVTSIEGFRAIVARTRNYRPDENEPAFIADDVCRKKGSKAMPSIRPRLQHHVGAGERRPTGSRARRCFARGTSGPASLRAGPAPPSRHCPGSSRREPGSADGIRLCGAGPPLSDSLTPSPSGLAIRNQSSFLCSSCRGLPCKGS
jgi:hypothetical protein